MSRSQILLIVFCLGTIVALMAVLQKKDAPRDQQRAADVQQADSPREQDAPPVTEAISAAPSLVGRQVCGECHAKNFGMHASHGHASTFSHVSESDLVAAFSGQTFEAGEDYGTYKYHDDEQGRLFASLPDHFGDAPFPLQYVLGSGQHAQTILTLAPGEDGQIEGIEHRVSCYPGGRIGLTPGHAKMKPQTLLELFGDSSQGKPLERCIYCHTTTATMVGEQIEDLIPNVNCEKCHGPGSEHVRLARTQPKPPPYSVGRDDWDTESEIQLCGDCHRLPRSVTEKEVREYPDLLVRFQPIGMLRSRCYLDSNRELKCTTCHNPHQSVLEEDPTEHVQDCLGCHQPNTKSHVACPVEPETGCIECHMPAIEMDTGIRYHDHWIRVHRDSK